jgi:hypothetical protein
MYLAQVAGGRLGALRRVIFVVTDHGWDVETAGTPQDVQQPKAVRLGDAPRCHEFTANPIDRPEVALKHCD